jgi:hypothetical protein
VLIGRWCLRCLAPREPVVARPKEKLRRLSFGGSLGTSGTWRRNKTPGVAIRPYRPASREMSLMLAIPYPKRSSTGFEKAE